MTEKRIARGDMFHVAYEPEGRLYVTKEWVSDE